LAPSRQSSSSSQRNKESYYPQSQFKNDKLHEPTKLIDYMPIETLFENSLSCQKVARCKRSCSRQEELYMITFMVFKHANIKQFGSPFAAKENNIEQLFNLTQMKHPTIA